MKAEGIEITGKWKEMKRKGDWKCPNCKKKNLILVPTPLVAVAGGIGAMGFCPFCDRVYGLERKKKECEK